MIDEVGMKATHASHWLTGSTTMDYLVVVAFLGFILGIYLLIQFHIRQGRHHASTSLTLRTPRATLTSLRQLARTTAPHGFFPRGDSYSHPGGKMQGWVWLVDINHRSFWIHHDAEALGYWAIGKEGKVKWNEGHLSCEEINQLQQEVEKWTGDKESSSPA